MDFSKRIEKSPALAALKVVSKFVSTMSLEDLEALASGRAILTLTSSDPSSRQEKMAIGDLTSRRFDYSGLQAALKAVDSTREGFKILSEARPTRSELEYLARSLDLPVMKQDTAHRLEEKVVESLIGSRLNSRAVRGR